MNMALMNYSGWGQQISDKHLNYGKCLFPVELERNDIGVEKAKGETIGVLLIDDEKDFVGYMAQLLKRIGKRSKIKLEIHRAFNGDEAVKTLFEKRGKIGLIITDLMHGGLHGAELIGYLERNFKNIPIIVISGMYEKLKQKIEADIYEGFPKPCDVETLAGTIEDVFSSDPC